MLVKVTQQHIERGTQCSPSCCPVSLAIDAASGYPCRVTGPTVEFLTYDGFKKLLPEFVAEAIKVFDQMGYMPQFEFEIPNMPKMEKIGGNYHFVKESHE